MSLHVHIERLVLDGLGAGPVDRAAVQAAVQAELARLLGAGGLAPPLQAGGTVGRVTGGTVRLGDGPTPDRLGARIAGAVHGGIGR